jgi:Ca2+-transporting ATPase
MSLQKYPEKTSKGAYLKDVDDLLKALDSSTKGLDELEATSRLEKFGKNEIPEARKDSSLKLFLKKLTEPLILLLLASASVSLFIGEKADAIGITVAVSLVVILGFIQEYRSERSVEALKKLTTFSARIIRGGELKEVLAEDLVPGDIVALNVGDRVATDIRLIETLNLQINEALLTGESKPTNKNTKTIEGEDTPLADRKNMAYMGTVVTNGKAKGVVTATGATTELGRISSIIQEVRRGKTPLQLKLDQLGKQISLYAIAIIAGIFIIGVAQGKNLLEMFTVGISLAVAAIPEGLPIVVTITLALGVTRMAKKKAIIRRLPAVEALGSTTVICTDKTGTLTQNEMTVKKIYTTEFIEVTGRGYERVGHFLKSGKKIEPKDDAHLMELLKVGLLCNNAYLNDGLIGQPTEGALLIAAFKAGLEDMRSKLERTHELPFDSEKKWMAVKYETEIGPIYFVKGATEEVILKCGKQGYFKGSQALTKKRKNEILGANDELACSGLRVIALAYGKELDDLTFVGLAGITDPPREGVKEAIEEVLGSNVKVVMITGDSKETAIAITKELDFYDERGIALSGAELEEMSEDELSEKVDRVNVFYRASPEHKMKIVRAYKNRGHIVSMTGDGVNDAPALKIADIGVAMGGAGTDVAKEASEMVLVDDNFATIVAAIEEGKSIFNNIKNFLRFELTTSVAALSVISFSTILGFPLPLNPIQILWINIIMDGPPAQSLGVEPLDMDVMKRPPRNPREPVINKKLILNVSYGALIMVLGTLSIFFLEINKGLGLEKRATTMAFTVFVMFQMFNALNCRSDEKSVFKLGFFSNKYVLLAIAGSIIMQLGIIYIPFFQFIFGTIALTSFDLLLVTAVASSVFFLDEIRKMVM